MKIVHIINSLAKGGAERLLVDVVPLYKQYGHHVTILQLSATHSSGDYLAILKAANVEVLSLGNGSLYNPGLIFRLKSLLKKEKFDIVHVHLFPSMYWASMAFRLLGRNKAVTVFTEHSTQNKRLNSPVLRPVDQFIYRSYDAVIAISDAIRTRLEQWTGTPGKIHTIRNGVNTSHFAAAPVYNRSFFTDAFGIPESSLIVLMTARFLYPKDHATVVKALENLPPHFHLIFAGEGDGKEAVQQLAQNAGLDNRVHFAGFRTDVPSLMKSVDINVLSSGYEGMSGVTLEALAAGKPFLGSDVPGINDVVPDSRYLFQAGNGNSLANAMLKIEDDAPLRKQMVEDGMAFARTFDVAIMIEKHIELYKRLLGLKRK